MIKYTQLILNNQPIKQSNNQTIGMALKLKHPCNLYVMMGKTKNESELNELFARFEESLKNSKNQPRFNGGLSLKDELNNFVPSIRPIIKPFVEFDDEFIIKFNNLPATHPFYDNLCNIAKYYNISTKCKHIFDIYDDKLEESNSNMTINMFYEEDYRTMDNWCNPLAIVLVNACLNFDDTKKLFTESGSACDDHRCVFDTPPIVHSAILHNVELCKLLLELGADLNSIETKSFSFQGNTLHWIVVTGMYQELSTLIPNDHPAWDKKNGLGLTPRDYLNIQ